MEVIKLEHSRVKLVFEVTADEFEKALDKAFEVRNAKVSIPGFRAGKAPRSIYERNYGVESLYDEALNVILNSKVQEAVSNQELAKTFMGQFEPVLEEKIERGATFHVALEIDVQPEVVLPEYKGIEVKKQVLTASEAEVEAAIKALVAKDITRVVKEEQVIASGDYATFDFVGSVDGVEFEGGKADNYELQIGSGQFIPGFEDQMIGMKAEEVKDLNVTFPENYGQPDLAGKAAVFKVTVHEVKTEVLPELTDEYVQGLNIEGVTNVEELKANKKAEIEAGKVTSERDRQFDEIVTKLIDSATFELPQSMINDYVAQYKSRFEQQAKMYNIPLETFIQLMGATPEQFEHVAQQTGKNQAMFSALFSKICEVENLFPTEEQLNAKAEADAKAQGNADVKAVLAQNAARYFNELSYNAFCDFMIANAVEVE